VFEISAGEVIKMKPYWFQEKIINSTRAKLSEGYKRIMIYLACGGGKTHIAAQIAKMAREKGNNVHFLADQNNLTEQTSKTFWEYGINHGIIQGDTQD
jgi:superfamily II DNA or RNA helicase